MAVQILLNIGIAIVWMVLKNNITVLEFVIGYIVGLLLLFSFKRFLNGRFYFGRVIAFVKLTLIFIRELIIANIDMVKIVLRPKLNIQPGIIAVPTKLKTEWEITMLAALISLTPGTLSMDFSPENDTIFVHTVHINDKEAEIKKIHDTFEKAILGVTSDA